MIKIESRRYRWLAGILLGALALSNAAFSDGVTYDETLQPEPRHEDIGALVAQFIQKSHYNQIAIDDELSSQVMDRYVDSLDGNKMYLLMEDVDYFEQYRYQLDDIVKSRPLDPVFEMFRIYRTRVRERLAYALVLLESEPDFSIDEEFQFDRSDMPWAES